MSVPMPQKADRYNCRLQVTLSRPISQLTFIAGLHADWLTAPWCVDQAMTGEAFKAYLRSQLAPTLKSGDIAICDNLPPYNPDLNPIEQVSAKSSQGPFAQSGRTDL